MEWPHIILLAWAIGFLATFLFVYADARAEAVPGQSSANLGGIFLMCLFAWPIVLLSEIVHRVTR